MTFDNLIYFPIYIIKPPARLLSSVTQYVFNQFYSRRLSVFISARTSVKLLSARSRLLGRLGFHMKGVI